MMQDKPTESSRIYWPGSNTPISRGNAFTSWRGRPSAIIAAEPHLYRPRKPARPPETGFAADGGAMKGLSAKADQRLMELPKRLAVVPHAGAYSKAKRGGRDAAA